MLAQVKVFLAAQGAAGRLRDDQHREVSGQVAKACYHLGAVHSDAVALTLSLQAVQNAISGLSVTEDGDD